MIVSKRDRKKAWVFLSVIVLVAGSITVSLAQICCSAG